MDLRTEIVEAQKARAELFKWKIILVAALGGAALGIAGESHGSREYLLALAPLVCVYVDTLCAHLDLRILIIGAFLRKNSFPRGSEGYMVRKYEQFVEKVRAAENRSNLDPFDLENFALYVTTGLLSLSVVLWGLFKAAPFWQALLLVSSGLAGFGMSFAVNHRFERRARSLRELEP